MVSLEQFKNIPSVYLMQANVCTVTFDVWGNEVECDIELTGGKEKCNK